MPPVIDTKKLFENLENTLKMYASLGFGKVGTAQTLDGTKLCGVCDQIAVHGFPSIDPNVVLCAGCWKLAGAIVDLSGFADENFAPAIMEYGRLIDPFFRLEGPLWFAAMARRYKLGSTTSDTVRDLIAVALVKRFWGEIQNRGQDLVAYWARAGVDSARSAVVHQLTPSAIEVVRTTRMEGALGSPPNVFFTRPLLVEIAVDVRARLIKDNVFLGGYLAHGKLFVLGFNSTNRAYVMSVDPAWDRPFEEMLDELGSYIDDADDRAWLVDSVRFLLTCAVCLETKCMPFELIEKPITLSQRPGGKREDDGFAMVRFIDFDHGWQLDVDTDVVPAGIIREGGYSELPLSYWAQDPYSLRDAARDFEEVKARLKVFRSQRLRGKVELATCAHVLGVKTRLEHQLPRLREETGGAALLVFEESRTIDEAMATIPKWSKDMQTIIAIVAPRVVRKAHRRTKN